VDEWHGFRFRVPPHEVGRNPVSIGATGFARGIPLIKNNGKPGQYTQLN